MHYPLATIDLQSIRDAIAVLDAEVFRSINTGLAAPWLDPVLLAITNLGLGLVQALIALTILVVGVVKKRDHLKRLGQAAFVAYAGSGIISSALKMFGDRPRPVLVMFDVRVVGKPLFVHSFPSGHATTAFAVAFVFAAFFPRWRWAFFGLAALIALSRVYLGVHFPFDVVFGSLLGSLIGIGSAWIFLPRQGQSPATTQDGKPGKSPVAMEEAE